MSISSVQCPMLEITVVECTQLNDIEGIKRHDSYVCIEHGSTKLRTRTCKDGGKNPVFNEKFMFSLIQGLEEINVVVWNSNPISHDHFIGNVKFRVRDVLSMGYVDRSWPLQTKTGRYAREMKLIMHCDTSNKPIPQSYTTPYARPPPYTAIPSTNPNSTNQPPSYISPYAHPPPYTAMSSTHPNTTNRTPIPYSYHPQVAYYSYPPPPSHAPSIYPPPRPYPVSPYAPPPPYASSYSPPGFHGMHTQHPY